MGKIVFKSIHVKFVEMMDVQKETASLDTQNLAKMVKVAHSFEERVDVRTYTMMLQL